MVTSTVIALVEAAVVESYGERRPYAVPESFDELRGPVTGLVTLPAALGWTGRTTYELDDETDALVFYERVLVDSVNVREVASLLDAERLSALWSRLFLPLRVRRLWETRFPHLTAAA